VFFVTRWWQTLKKSITTETQRTPSLHRERSTLNSAKTLYGLTFLRGKPYHGLFENTAN
jgi:hypothetical protein